MKKEASFKPIFFAIAISAIIAMSWESIPIIKNIAHSILDPTAGTLIHWNLNYGMLILILIISLFMTLLQKYGTDQETLRELKKEQKILQEEMKKYKEHPEKLMSLQKKQLEFLPKTMKLSMRPVVYTSIPLILFFRWFHDIFTIMGDPQFFGFFNWFWFYIVGSMVFNLGLRKVLKVV
jgi:uncharacterized membrane protein (DUF106 family)